MTPFKFLDLPPELRNRIYRDATVSTEQIRVQDAGYARPPLLSTCRQVRSEAVAIYYAENVFKFYIQKYDSTTAFRFRSTLPELKQQPTQTKDNGYSNTPHWRNLLMWLQRYHKGEVGRVSCAEVQRKASAQEDVVVVGGMFSIVAELSDLPWVRVKKILMAQRAVLEVLDPRWSAPESG